MAKRKLPKGIREKNGAYEARARVNGIKINMYSTNLDNLIEDFEHAKEQAGRRVHYMKSEMSLNEWFDEWFDEVKAHKVKETSIRPIKNNFKRTFGFHIGTMKLIDIKPMDVQKALNAMEKRKISTAISHT